MKQVTAIPLSDNKAIGKLLSTLSTLLDGQIVTLDAVMHSVDLVSIISKPHLHEEVVLAMQECVTALQDNVPDLVDCLGAYIDYLNYSFRPTFQK